MKLVTYVLKNVEAPEQRIGVLTKDEKQIVDLKKANELENGREVKYFDDMIAFLEGGIEAKNAAEKLAVNASDDSRVSIESAQLLAPIPRPRSLRDTLCYDEHLANCKIQILKSEGIDVSSADPETLKPDPEWYVRTRSPFYKGNINSVIGTDVDVAYPEMEPFKDYELELAVIIGKEGKNIVSRNAMDYVAGYTIMNDFTGRTAQLTEGLKDYGMGPMNSKDFANAMGPCMVTADCFDPNDAKTIARINGEVVSTNNVGTAYHKIPDVLENISRNVTLYPGDIIAMGTVGNGCGFEIGRKLKIDDVIELEIEGIGRIRNKVVTPGLHKFTNRLGLYKRFVCGDVDGKSDFVIDDYPDIIITKYTDVWKIKETPAEASATGEVDMGSLPFEHEAPPNGSTFRFIQTDASLRNMVGLETLPPEKAEEMYENVIEIHKSIGTHHLPSREDMKKTASMHVTDSANLFICVEPGAISINDEDEFLLETGDAFIQLGCMHGWSFKGDKPGLIGGLLVDADLSTKMQLEDLPQPVMKSGMNKFKRYVSGTMASSHKETGLSRLIMDDYSPNETELFDENNKHIGYVGEIWKTFAPKADISGEVDTITGPVEARPPKNGINFRMMELLPNCEYKADFSDINYYTVLGEGEIEAISDGSKVRVKHAEHIVKLKNVNMVLRNVSDKPVRMSNFIFDTVR